VAKYKANADYDGQPKCKEIQKLDSLRCFSKHRSPMPHFGGAHCAARGPMTPHSNSAEIFVQCTYPQVLSSCLIVRQLSCWQTNKRTNRRRWKHPNALRYAKTLGNQSDSPMMCQSRLIAVHAV